MTDQENKITVQLDTNSGRIQIGSIAELTFKGPVNSVITVDHTIVSSDHQGQGLAGVLFNEMVKLVEAQAWKVIPECSYIAKKFERKAELQHLVVK